MPSPPVPLPSHLRDRAFSLSDGLAAGLTIPQLRHSRLSAPHRGVRSSAPSPPEPELLSEYTVRTAQAYLPRLRTRHGELFSHTTALVLHGAPIRFERTPPHVSIPLPHGPARSPGVRGHNSVDPTSAAFVADEELMCDFPCVPASVALIQSAPLLGFRELVVAVDHLIKWRDNGATPPIVAQEDLREAVRTASTRGIRRLRLAVDVARVGAESRGESLMHYELAKHGLDLLELQAVIHDRGGAFIGRFDACDRTSRKIMEYDGEQHRTSRRQYLRDIRRLERVRDEKYGVLRLHSEDFAEDAIETTAARMRDFLGETARPIDPALARCFAEPEWHDRPSREASAST